ncbi:hypothetical protein AAG570_010556 [Ranatra chinensis]|uniref:Protein AAR2 homolog n=1 Tax=Ranatra chinensis TaxID=642074 RepID=A0ABD0YQ14_9HEMI
MEELDIDQELAKRLLVEGGILILLNVPVGTEFGFDIKSWYTDENFKGIKMIPPGVHMISYSATNKHGDSAPKISFFHNFKTSEIVVKVWDTQAEELNMKDMPEEEKSRFRSDILNIDRCLAPYPFEILKKWKKLSDSLTEDLIGKLTPESGVIRAALELSVVATKPEQEDNSNLTRKEREELLLPQLIPVPGTGIRLTPLPRDSYPPGSSPAEITKHSLDSTYMLDSLISTMEKQSDILAEIQFSFLCFLVGLSLEAFEHWKRLIILMCSCVSALQKRRELYQQFLQVLETHLSHIPEDFLVDIVASENVVYTALRDLFRNMSDGDEVEGRLRCDAERLRHRLTLKFGWDFEDLDQETGDDAPVIVEL